jgi:peptidoglycan/xylan/chitin deacetylase (PgdA/CDA1 family)
MRPTSQTISADALTGTDIFSCTRDKTIALYQPPISRTPRVALIKRSTFDDGPYLYTTGLLDILKQKGVKATFFITGNNLDKGAIDASSWGSVIQRMYAEGHQIASHTWTHQDLSSLSETMRRYEMVRNEQAFLSVLGRYPTYMRPPYISCNDACRASMAALGYHVIIWDLDTDDYNNVTPQLIQNSKNLVKQALAEKWDSYMSIAHDIHWQTVYNLTAYQIDAGKAAGYTREFPRGQLDARMWLMTE